MHYQRQKTHGDPNIEIPKGFRHGYRNHRFYGIWKSIKVRCYNETYHAYKNYGARGIKVSDGFKESAECFIEYIESLPNSDKASKKGLTLDRIDNNGNYEKGNLRWATRKEQRKNQRPREEWKK